MWATESRWTRRDRLISVAIVATNLVALVTLAGWETVPIHLLVAAAGLTFALRPPGAISSRDALEFGVALTLATLGNELLEGIEPLNDVYESWLVFVLVVGLGWLAVRRAQAARALKSSLEERDKLLQRQERLINDLSHELRTPATIARGHLELLLRASDNGNPQGTAQIALDELSRIDRIVARLLMLARAERGTLVEIGAIETEPFLEDVLLRWSETAERSWRLGPVPRGTLEADPDALRIALDALLENAVKYTESGDSIELHASADDGSLVIEVADSGPGVPQDAAEAIFDRSERMRGDDGMGLGLGLAIVDAIARAHGGSCVLRPSSAGSTFALTLPGYRPDGATAAGVESA
jgi:signal transduction histidine kinase